MKRFLTILLTTLALAGLLCVTASAASFDGPAAELAALVLTGIFLAANRRTYRY